jgi:hypothetical protein
VETLLYIVYRFVLIPCSRLLAMLARKKDRQRFATRDGYGAASVMTRHETNCERQNIQEIKVLAAKRDAICKEMADLLEADPPHQGGEAYKTKLAELAEVLNQIALLTPDMV